MREPPADGSEEHEHKEILVWQSLLALGNLLMLLT
jgi:hypothetical protein